MILLPIQMLAEYKERALVFRQARAIADSLSKPLLNCGCGSYQLAIEYSDVNFDVIPRDVPSFILGNIEDMYMFYDKQFGAIFCAHVLEHVENLEKTRAELKRVSDYQFIITPSPLFVTTWLHPRHKRVFQDTRGEKVLIELPLKV